MRTLRSAFVLAVFTVVLATLARPKVLHSNE